MERQGFTLVELLATLAIATILLTMVFPALSRFITESQLATTHNRLLTTLRAARSEAVKRGDPIVVCNGEPQEGCDSDNGWEKGWYSAVVPRGVNECQDADGDGRCDSHGGEIMYQEGSVAEGVSVDGNGINLVSRVRFKPNGIAAGYAGTLSICPPADADIEGTGIVISIVGRMRQAQPSDLAC